MDKVFTGNLDAVAGQVYDYTEITGRVAAYAGASFPSLTTVGGRVDAYEGSSLPSLTTVGGGVAAGEGALLPALTTVGGRVIADKGSLFPALTTVGGGVAAGEGASFPVLTTVGGWVDAYKGALFPALTTVGGGVDAYEGSSFPALTTVGGGVAAGEGASFPVLVSKDDVRAVRAALAAQGLTLDDGVLCHVLRRRGAVTRARRVGSTEESYLITDGTHTAHGRTLAEARADLRLKRVGRDVSAYAGWTAATVVSLEDGIAAYRAVTGACGLGVSDFLKSRTLPATFPVSRMLAETAGAYGHDVFAAFVGAK